MNSLSRKVSCLAVMVCLGVSLIYAAAPTLRDEVNLAGNWTGPTAVPNLVTTSFSTRTYQRTFSVPSSWAGRKIFLEIEAINWSDVARIDGTEVGRSTGGWLPHSYDITSRVTPGATHTLTMDVSGTYPAGWPAGKEHVGGPGAGAIHDISIRAYGNVAIRDAEVVTSVANKTITVKYEVRNFSTIARTVTVDAGVYQSTGGSQVLALTTASATLAAGASQTLTATSAWTNPNLWWPTDPKLYHLCSSVKESGATIDSQTVRFGFRECRIVGRFIQLNGVRVNFRGESIELGKSASGSNLASVGMNNWIAMEKSVNANSIRFHYSPPPAQMINVCDEQGILVMPETPLWQSDATGSTQTRTIWMPGFIKHYRNHASVVHWSSQNECYGSGANISILTDIMRAHDGSGRPIWSEDVDFANQTTACKHYPEGYGNMPNTGLIYSTNWISPTIPQSCGEFAPCCWMGNLVPDIYYWQAIWSRGMRYNNVAVIHPYNYSDWILGNSSFAAASLLKNSYAPVALFDRDYDGLGISPVKDNSFPSTSAGSTVVRTLVMYNDEFSDEMVTALVEVKSGGTIRASGTKIYQVPLGGHVSFPCTLQVPYVGGSTMDLVLSTRKGGVDKFTESRRFTVTGATSGASSSTVALGGSGANPATPYMQISPAGVDISGATGANAASRTITLTNGGGGTLGALTTRITYGPGAAAWVTATPGGSGNARSIALQFSTASISGGTFTAQLIVKSIGALPDSIVCPITLTQAGPDLTPPAIVRVSGTSNTVTIVFNEQLEGISSTTAANYALNNGVTVTSAALGSDNASVTLTTSALTNGSSYAVTVNNVTDRASPANRIANNSTATFTAGRAITKIRFHPRQDMAARMNGGRFEGATGAVDGAYVPLATITGDPVNNQWTEITTLQNADLGFTALRYYSDGGFGNVAEVEFYSGDVKLTGTAFGTAGTWGGSSADFTKVFDGDVTTFFDCSQSVAYAGLDLNGGATTFRLGRGVVSRGVVEVRIGGAVVSLPTEGLALSGRGTLFVHDMRGQLVASMRLVAIDNGRIDMPSVRLGEGCYAVLLEAHGISARARLVVTR